MTTNRASTNSTEFFGIQREGKRKLFHLLSLFYAFFYLWAGRTPTLWLLGSGVGIGAGIEAVRLRHETFNHWLIQRFGGIHREKEVHRPSGIFWTLLGCFLTVLVVPERDIVCTAFLYLSVGDGLAGFVGRGWGRLRVGKKSVEGSLACFLGTWAVGSIFLTPEPGRPEVFWGAAIATLLEAVCLPPDDNLTLPFLSALALHGIRAAS